MVVNNEKGKSVYETNAGDQTIEKHTLSVLVDNEPGVLARVIGLFSGRGYNIESLTVAEVSKTMNQSRMTIVAVGTPNMIAQIINQLSRLVPVHKVTDLTEEGPHVKRELALVKVGGDKQQLEKALSIVADFKAEIIDSTDESYVFQLIDRPSIIEDFIEKITPNGMLNISRTGAAAMSRGKDKF